MAQEKISESRNSDFIFVAIWLFKPINLFAMSIFFFVSRIVNILRDSFFPNTHIKPSSYSILTKWRTFCSFSIFYSSCILCSFLFTSRFGIEILIIKLCVLYAFPSDLIRNKYVFMMIQWLTSCFISSYILNIFIFMCLSVREPIFFHPYKNPYKIAIKTALNVKHLRHIISFTL